MILSDDKNYIYHKTLQKLSLPIYLHVLIIIFETFRSTGCTTGWTARCIQPATKCKRTTTLFSFYRAMLCIRGTSHGPVSVCPSVTSRCSTKTAKHRITQTTPHDTPGNLVFWRQRSPRNSTGVTPYGAPNAGWVGQNRQLSTNNRLYLENVKR